MCVLCVCEREGECVCVCLTLLVRYTCASFLTVLTFGHDIFSVH